MMKRNCLAIKGDLIITFKNYIIYDKEVIDYI